MRRRLGESASAIALAVLIAGTSGQAAAFELFGIRIFGSSEPAEADVIGDPQSYEVTFDAGPAEGRVLNAVRGASRLWSDRDEPASGSAGLIGRAKSDYARMVAALYTEGHYGGSVSILVDGREAADLPVDSTLPDPAVVTITVDIGPQFSFGQATIGNQAPPATERGDEVALPSEEGLASGEIARSGAVIRGERLAIEAWRQQGFAKAEIADRTVTANHNSQTVDVSIIVDPSQRAAYGQTRVEGAQRMDAEYIRYMTDLPEGQEYDPDDIERARQRLARLDVFQALTVREADEIARNGLLPMTVNVQERPLRRLGVGGTYSTVDGLGVETFWLHRNLFGKAERLRLDARVGGIGDTLDVQEFDYSLGATFTRPGVFTPDTNFVASLLGKREVLDVYTETSVAARMGFTHIFSDYLSGEIFAEAKYADFEDDLGERSFTTFGLPAKLTYDTRDNSADATEGYFLEVTAEPFYEFEFGNIAGRATAEARAYYGIDADDRFVLAGKLKIGSIVGADLFELPPDKLFLSGGGGSTRGYAYRGIGVVNASGEVTGGRSLIEASGEIRTKVTDSIGLVGFADVGYVGAESFPDFSEDLKVGVGIGLRYQTGLGPIRLDAAIPLDPGPDDPDFALYVGIGQAF
ncbi:autotransporter assembly complex protein TamA [Georhizobium profundi]|uniref:autotransporter assembly complex protein TamA n=1 Tax=Georhizobium profundi TaxID=2341112 RepID=UPI001FE0397C|nr:autotransporter assembly complex family protein [Georhizobium profundi]